MMYSSDIRIVLCMFQSSLTDTPPEPCAQLFNPSSHSEKTPPIAIAADSHGLTQRRSFDEAAVWSALSRVTAVGGGEGGGGGGGNLAVAGGGRAGRGVNGRMRKAKRIDVASRILFPLIFALFNLSYWSNYLYQAAMERDKALS